MAIKQKAIDKASVDGSAAKTVIEANKKVPFAVVESYKTIRTNLMFILAQNNGKIVTFSSSNASEGKSTTAINVAVAFSQLGEKILLIDADMRRSSIHKKMRLENNSGLSDVLAGFTEFEDVVTPLSDTLDVLTAGRVPPNPSELLGSVRFSQLIEKIREKYRYIIIDTPPTGIVSDALVISPYTDGMVLIVRDSFTPGYSIKQALSAAEFANINILGAIMNGANSRSNRRYSYRRYSYGKKYYKYGYEYGYSKPYTSYEPENPDNR